MGGKLDENPKKHLEITAIAALRKANVGRRDEGFRKIHNSCNLLKMI
jgi:hypothetical protein